MYKHLILLAILCCSCDDASSRVKKKRKKNNYVCEKIYRNSDEFFYQEDHLVIAEKTFYPWQSRSNFTQITMNTLRCRGSDSHKSYKIGKKTVEDCNGLHDHGLPYKDKQEFVYPVLIDTLNYLQDSLQKEVVVVSGHRCPKHHRYVTRGQSRLTRYMIGAKVDFYIKGYENDLGKVIETIATRYANDEKRYKEFVKSAQKDGTYSFRNKELRISYGVNAEAKKFDNVHFAVISLEVLYDREKDQRVYLEWDQAYKGYIRN